MSDFNYDYNKEIEEIKNMIMYLDDQKNVHDILSIQSEVKP